ncbi:polysaccharide deacetylase [Bacillus sp. FJAT-29790]|uniref:polysaccharide deacetylase family protein n=1 Tax=Bacillus sp. FJAT-29790 TaxID=1895002 RepID=UPI001C235960|nr:polysaccharide deacetylase [Bacillus sp. FJAT-29790]MBU8877522.1 polysaccharide deacetylase [Bacillus sp. FJAT-29790]
MQISGKVKLPKGKRVAVNIGCDFDAASVWLGAYKLFSPAYMSRGEFGAEVGTPRLLKLFDRYHIKTSWCIPGHTVDTHTDICKEIVAKGHEICHHGYAHESVTELSYDEEKAVMEKGLTALQSIGVTPRGYRSPDWDFSQNTLAILEEYGFRYDSSLMGNDFYPYRIRPVNVNLEKGNTYGPPSEILEIPVSWYLDDFPTQEHISDRGAEGLRSVHEVFDRWKSTFDYACNIEGASFVLTLHPQTSGRAHFIKELEQFIQYMESNGAWFTTLGEIYDTFEETSVGANKYFNNV